MKRNPIAKVVSVVIGSYVTGFFVIWIGGGYVLTESGEVRRFMGIDTGIAVPDIAQWQPLFGHCQETYTWSGGRVGRRCDLIGKIYYPFLVCVQKRHPTMRMIGYDGRIEPFWKIPPKFKIHPLKGGELSNILEAE